MKKNWRQWIGLIALIFVVLVTVYNHFNANNAGTSDLPVIEDNRSGQDIAEEPEQDYAEIIAEADEEILAEDTAFEEAVEETVVDEEPEEIIEESAAEEENTFVKEDASYNTKDEVAAYIHQFGHLPSNYITKKDAEALGWVSSKGNLQKVAPGMSIGGDRFGNREGNLPTQKGRKYYECDIDYSGGKRNGKRIVFSDDGLVFYTEDHYETFEQLY